MSKRSKWILTSVGAFLIVLTMYTMLSSGDSIIEDEDVQPTFVDDTLRYASNQFTQPDYVSDPIEIDTSLEGFEKMAENDLIELYVEEESLALKVVDQRTGYIWNSSLDDIEDFNLNDTWQLLANSAMTIDYLDEKSNVKTMSLLGNAEKPTIEKVDNGFKATIDFSEIDITVQLQVRLIDNELEIHIPHSELHESEQKIVSLKVYPFLGAVHQDEIEGYMFVPDGSGALMRFQSVSKGATDAFNGAVYGKDEGFRRNPEEIDNRILPNQDITIPVYGMVHGIKQNGIFTEIESGEDYSEILAYPAGVSTDFNWMTSEYHYRHRYFQPTSQEMSGYNTYQSDMNVFDITEKITFLANDEADYIGMAQTYQQSLIEKGMLKKGSDQVDVRLEFLGSEVKKGLLWNSVYEMTRVQEIPSYIEQLQKQNVNTMHVVYRGWSEGGLTGTLPNKFPVEKRLGTQADFREVNDQLQSKDIPIYYYTDYTKAYENAAGFSGRSDVARKVNSETIVKNLENNRYYYLSPFKSLEIAKKDIEKYKENDISHLAIDSSASVLFSDFNKETSSRIDVKETYQAMLEMLDNGVGSLALYKPNDYMWRFTERYLDIPMHSSNYSFVTDTVPFLQIVLKGYMPYYGSFSNFQPNSVDDVLRMIEYGVYPSFYLTSEPSHQLVQSPSKDVYTSQFSDWEDVIVEQYALIEGSLGQVEGETIVDRIVHDRGVVEVQYSNNKSIIINYKNETVEIDTVEISAKGFKVVDRGEQS